MAGLKKIEPTRKYCYKLSFLCRYKLNWQEICLKLLLHTQRSMALEKYQYLIENLAPSAFEHNFVTLLEEQTPTLSEETRFNLLMEIKRLCQPCIKAIDLRTLCEEECTVVLHDGLKHYLSSEGNELFMHLLSQYHSYTLGVMEGVLNYFSKQRDINLGHSDSEQHEQKSDINPITHVSRVESLLSYPSRKEERLIERIEVRLFLSSTLLICAHTVDISRQGLRIHLDDETELTLIKGYRPIQLVFVGLEDEQKLAKLPVPFIVSGISQGYSRADIHLTRNWNNGPSDYNKYLDKLFEHRKRDNTSVETTNTQLAIESKIYEQAVAATCLGISLFINTKDILSPFVECACHNDFNIDIVDYWQDENDQQVLGFLFNKERLRRLLIESDTELSTTVYCFNHINKNKIYFYSATDQELENNTELKDVYLSYASRKASWKVYKLSCHQVDTNDALLPSSLPNGINQVINQDNRPHAPKLEAKLKHLSHMITMTDITHNPDQLRYHQNQFEKDKIKLLSVFGHARNRPPKPIEIYKFAWFDRRTERRYKLRTEISLLQNKKEYLGVSEDFSVQGLKIELEESLKAKLGDIVWVSFVRLQDITKEYTLQTLPYEVMRASEDGYVIHLKTAGQDEAETTQAFFKMLIRKNKDRLKPLPSDQTLVGLRRALRVLQARNTPQVCVFTHQQKDLHFPAKTSLNLQKSREFPYLRHNMPAGFLDLTGFFQVPQKGPQHLASMLNKARKNQLPVSYELLINYDNSEVNPVEALRCVWEIDLLEYADKLSFIRSAIQDHTFYACRVTCMPKQTPLPQLYQEELNYLKKHDPQQAKSIEELAWSFSGHVFLTDITGELLMRYGLYQN